MRTLLIVLFCATSLISTAQEKTKAKFGKVDPEDFKTNGYSIDKSANAIVIADIGATEFLGNNKGGFSLEFTRYKRIHILNKKGYDAAGIQIALYSADGEQEELTSLKAVTYNLQSNKVVETKLDQKNVSSENKKNENSVIHKFTFPDIKEGSIIEMEYKITSNFTFNLQPWNFQELYPTLWSQYTVEIPEYFYYITLVSGTHPFEINKTKSGYANFRVSDSKAAVTGYRTGFSAGITQFRWAMKNIPALKEESAFSSLQNNYAARIQFRLAELRPTFFPQKTIIGTWEATTDKLLKDEKFGSSLHQDNAWLTNILGTVTNAAKTDIEKAHAIFAYVRDNITCSGYNKKYLEKKLELVLSSRVGNVAEINLLLTAMLVKAGFNADPVLLSTRSNGYAYAQYPLLDKYNYVISRLVLDGKTYYLDASRPGLGFARLPADVYNGQAKVIDKTATTVELPADSLIERKVTSVIIIDDGKGSLSGTVQQLNGYAESYKLRNTIKEKGESTFLKEIQKQSTTGIEMIAPAIDSLNNYDDPVFLHYDFNINPNNENVYRFNTMFGQGWADNPISSAERIYPIDMPNAIDENYLLRMDIPSGYIIDEIPKQMKMKLNEQEDGIFEYLISVVDNTISIRSRIRLKKTNYLPEENSMLRDFFAAIVKKHAEQIVFKKKK